MLSKVVLIISATVFLLLGVFYFTTDKSYQDSFEARFYYFVGNYKKAYEFADKSYSLNPYNKMAFTVLVQSKIALDYANYIQMGNRYFKKIDEISSKKEYKDADKIRVKLMCEIMLGEYKKLSPTKLTNIDLIENAKKMNEKFERLYKELF